MNNRIELIKGDITKIHTDAIVNTANTSLLGGGGVDGAIHRTGGKAILEDCYKIRERQGSCKTGEAVITTGGKLPAKYVIHTVGPVWSKSNSVKAEQLLENAYRNSLKVAVVNNIETIAFPNISIGIYHFPKQEAAEIAIDSVKTFLDGNNQIKKVIFVCFDEENYQIYKMLLYADQ
ncbi:O-acetyl-ADP-ribose deacetylase [Mucilaginibacter auburnensis]|uniref:O-acetyl-ADP-ribose deacetylase (Regulator of RNase III) n=1 Tax=Mucilaginibacter auburnensis TaxID=1457233 RepID=A0A2H9VLB8_9SPHI|nr:O-acetyl-ADP-ribose deacetylase [Mucilaginibacter auburnensis]PJJ79138.1 O-acetyl-ADP-ribose deacetylase (regulator of RNase III) [Mucilaginibacter auburnensis]